jgi:AbrB family looped-hinge helix DNA binding protein
MRAESMVGTASMSTKGQIVVPEAIRKSMHIESGDQFVVYAHGETLMFNRISRPNASQVEAMFARTRALARKAGLKRSDIPKIVKQVRKEARDSH